MERDKSDQASWNKKLSTRRPVTESLQWNHEGRNSKREDAGIQEVKGMHAKNFAEAYLRKGAERASC